MSASRAPTSRQHKQTNTRKQAQTEPSLYPPTYHSSRRRVGLGEVLSSPEEEALLYGLDQTGEHSSVQPRSRTPMAAGAESGQTGTTRGSRTGVAGGGPAGTYGQGLRPGLLRQEAGAGGGGPAGAGVSGGTSSVTLVQGLQPAAPAWPAGVGGGGPAGPLGLAELPSCAEVSSGASTGTHA